MSYPWSVDDSQVCVTLSPASSGQRWKAFLPHTLFIGKSVSLDGNSAYSVIAATWSRGRSKAGDRPWVPVGRSRSGLRLESTFSASR
jgi:hypothetical protein